jgi:hypothetical protein
VPSGKLSPDLTRFNEGYPLLFRISVIPQTVHTFKPLSCDHVWFFTNINHRLLVKKALYAGK